MKNESECLTPLISASLFLATSAATSPAGRDISLEVCGCELPWFLCALEMACISDRGFMWSGICQGPNSIEKLLA